MGMALHGAISKLAGLKPGWALAADTDPTDFLLDVHDELVAERAAREKAEAMLREMVKELNEERHRVFAVEGESAEDDWADWCIRVDELIDRYRAEFGEDK